MTGNGERECLKIHGMETISSPAPTASAKVKVQRPSLRGVGVQGEEHRSAVHAQRDDMVCSPWRHGEVLLTRKNRNVRQNVKKPDKDKFKLRKAFCARPGTKLVVHDQDQLEARILAAAANEPKMIDIFRLGQDPHLGNAVNIFNTDLQAQLGYQPTYEEGVKAKKTSKLVADNKLPPEALTPQYEAYCLARDHAKTLGYAASYGMRSRTLANRMGITQEEAAAMLEKYLEAYPAVEAFNAESVDIARTYGFSFTYLGRRRYLPEIRSRNALERYKAERIAGNNAIQGTASDIMKLAMIKLYRDELEKKYGAKMLLQVHDELIFEVPEEHAEEVSKIVEQRMEDPFYYSKLECPLRASGGIADNWYAAKG